MKQLLIILCISISPALYCQTSNNIEEIIQLGDEWKFEEAIELIKSEINLDPENPELYYWLGRYSHYMVYDTRPFPGKSDQWSSEQIIKPLLKAIELDPKYGDAKYFLAAEYGSRAGEALKTGNVEQYKKELLEAKTWGGFPLHAIEYGRNILKSCDTNSILFVNGDAEFNVLHYVQAIEGYRNDVSVIGIAFLERPYYIKLIRDGIPDAYKAVPISINDNLIMEMHNYKWRENDIKIPVPEQIRNKYNLNDTMTYFSWHIKPNVGEKQLWTGTAMLINIIETNQWKRPVHFTLYGSTGLDGILDNLQKVGLTSRLVPMKVYGTKLEYDTVKFESVMFDPKNYKNYPDIIENDQPRVSYAFGQMSRRRIFDYAVYQYRNGNYEKMNEVLQSMHDFMPPDIHPLSSDIERGIKYLQEEMEKKK